MDNPTVPSVFEDTPQKSEKDIKKENYNLFLSFVKETGDVVTAANATGYPDASAVIAEYPQAKVDIDKYLAQFKLELIKKQKESATGAQKLIQGAAEGQDTKSIMEGIFSKIALDFVHYTNKDLPTAQALEDWETYTRTVQQ